MSIVFNPIVPVTINLTARPAETQLDTPTIPNNSVGSKFIIQIEGQLPFGNSNVVTLSNTTSTVVYNIYDRCGNYVRTDRLYDAIRFRKIGLLPFSGCNPYNFQAMIGSDPDRIIILNNLPHSGYTAPVTSSSSSSTSDGGNQ